MKKNLVAVIVLFLAAFLLVRSTIATELRIYPYSVEGSWLSQIQFVKEYWPKIWWNPYWFLGYPAKFSSNPLFIFGLGLVCRIFLNSDVFQVYRLLVGIFFCLLPATMYLFLRDMRFGVITSFFAPLWAVGGISLLFVFPQVFVQARSVAFLPFSMFSTYLLGNGPKVIAFSFALLSLIGYRRYLEIGGRKWLFIFVSLVTPAVLISSSISAFIFLSILALLLAGIANNSDEWRRYLCQTIFAGVCCLLVLGIWYTPFYWYHSLNSPSLGGKPLVSVGKFFLNFSIVFMPLVIGFWWAKGRSWVKDRRLSFAFWLNLGFIILALGRFIADSDFWQDYTAYGLEIDFGVAMVVGMIIEGVVAHFNARFKERGMNSAITAYLLLTVCYLPLFLWRFNSIVRNDSLSRYGTDYADSFEYSLSNFLAENVQSTERVFVSGSLTFWLNYFSPHVMQVRGGDEPASIHPYWAHGSYQIREGQDPELADLWLKALGASWVVVHTPSSADPYHDFKYSYKFEQMKDWQKVFENNGNQVYQLQDYQDIFGGVVKTGTVGISTRPQGGEDKSALQEYVSTHYQQLDSQRLQVGILDNQTLLLDGSLPEEYQIGISQTYSPQWQLLTPSDSVDKGEVGPDSLGNIMYRPAKTGIPIGSKLVYGRHGTEWLLRGLFFLSGIILMSAYPRSYIWFRENIFELDIIGLGEEDDY